MPNGFGMVHDCRGAVSRRVAVGSAPFGIFGFLLGGPASDRQAAFRRHFCHLVHLFGINLRRAGCWFGSSDGFLIKGIRDPCSEEPGGASMQINAVAAQTYERESADPETLGKYC
jgi:hypothetical protein